MMVAARPKSPCPICKRETESRPTNMSAPFCSVRCRQVDLGKWLDGDYRVPVAETDEGDGEGEGRDGGAGGPSVETERSEG
jgi:uncharacterized protein